MAFPSLSMAARPVMPEQRAADTPVVKDLAVSIRRASPGTSGHTPPCRRDAFPASGGHTPVCTAAAQRYDTATSSTADSCVLRWVGKPRRKAGSNSRLRLLRTSPFTFRSVYSNRHLPRSASQSDLSATCVAWLCALLCTASRPKWRRVAPARAAHILPQTFTSSSVFLQHSRRHPDLSSPFTYIYRPDARLVANIFATLATVVP